ncbi:MAG: CidA/LrgA family protein [Fusobacteriaceae bacterium]
MLLQLAIIFAINYTGFILEKLLKIPLPGVMIGMVLFYILLETKIIKLSKIEKTADILIFHMMLFLIPGMVGIIEYTKDILPQFLKIIFLLIITTGITMAVTAKTVHFMILFLAKFEKEKK